MPDGRCDLLCLDLPLAEAIRRTSNATVIANAAGQAQGTE